MARKLAAELGLGVGISSGANFLGALIAQEELGTDKTIVTVFPDDNKKYLSTDLLRHEPVKDGFLSTDIKLLSVKAFKRVCDTCCDPDICLNGCSDDSEVHKVDDTQIPECPRRK